ncbi:MAG: hypothetical protein ACRDV8_12765 [Acidimicrobiales bacterium]
MSKMWLIRGILADRRTHPSRYSEPHYEPFEVPGATGDAVVAFRRAGLVVVAACRHEIPEHAVALDLGDGMWRDLSTGRLSTGRVELGVVLAGAPVAVLGAEVA